MERNETVIFIGQGPNQSSWERSVETARRLQSKDPETFCRKLSQRLALTGVLGNKVAALLGMTRAEFIRKYRRLNLNDRWNGKNGRGDAFDEEAGRAAAVELLADCHAARMVLLGQNVARCFGLEHHAPLSTGLFMNGIQFFLLPHPSGINRWWNEPKNARAAQKKLREFVR